MNYTKVKVCGCSYQDDKGKFHRGVYILNRKTNTFTVINKKLEKVIHPKNLVTYECSMGNIFIEL